MKPKKPKPTNFVDVIIKHWRKTIGSALVITSVFMVIFKVITTETMAAIIAALIAAGYIPTKRQNNENDDSDE